MGANGNGKIDQRIYEAQKRLSKSVQPLQELDRKITELTGRLAAVNEEAATAKAEFEKAKDAYKNSPTPEMSKRFRSVASKLAPIEKELEEDAKAIQENMADLQRKRIPHEAAMQQASAVLANVSVEVRLEVLDREIGTAKYKAAEHETAMREWMRRHDALREEKRVLEYNRREADWRAGAAQRAANFKAANAGNSSLREPNVRQGF